MFNIVDGAGQTVRGPFESQEIADAELIAMKAENPAAFGDHIVQAAGGASTLEEEVLHEEERLHEGDHGEHGHEGHRR